MRNPFTPSTNRARTPAGRTSAARGSNSAIRTSPAGSRASARCDPTMEAGSAKMRSRFSPSARPGLTARLPCRSCLDKAESAEETMAREFDLVVRGATIVDGSGGEPYEGDVGIAGDRRSEEHTSELQSLMRISYAVFCLKKKNKQ